MNVEGAIETQYEPDTNVSPEAGTILTLRPDSSVGVAVKPFEFICALIFPDNTSLFVPSKVIAVMSSASKDITMCPHTFLSCRIEPLDSPTQQSASGDGVAEATA